MSNGRGPDRPDVLVLAGGGIDSTLCIHQLAQEAYRVRALHIDYGQRASPQEWKSVRRTAYGLGIEADQVLLSPAIRRDDPRLLVATQR